MSINIRWGQQTYSVSLPASKESPLTAAELSDALNWNEEQFLNLVITGLKDSNGTVIPFTMTNIDSTYTQLTSWDEMLKPGETYDVVFKDIRESDIDKLTEEQKAEIRKEFDSIDEDGNGAITVEEAKAYYERKTQQYFERMDRLKRYRMESASSEEERQSIERKYDGFIERERKFNESRLAELLKKDTNGDGIIEWHEFLVSEAPLYLIRSSIKSKLK